MKTSLKTTIQTFCHDLSAKTRITVLCCGCFLVLTGFLLVFLMLCPVKKENHDEKPTNSFLYSLVMDTYSGGTFSSAPFLDMPLNHKVFLAQFVTIKQIAEKESCVIVGRCADYALSDNPNCLNVFIRSDMDDRIKRISKRLDITENKAKDMCIKKDKQRSSYYNYYTSKKWGDARSYDLCINTSKVSVDDAVDLILKYRENMRNFK